SDLLRRAKDLLRRTQPTANKMHFFFLHYAGRSAPCAGRQTSCAGRMLPAPRAENNEENSSKMA
ncbi:hypothetical protein A2U01_0085810, partial [Trifolium medium]|nr:hypothetical protein [Trifolium medium]